MTLGLTFDLELDRYFILQLRNKLYTTMTLTGNLLSCRLVASSRHTMAEKLPQLTEKVATGGFPSSIHAESGTLVKQIIHL